MLNSKNRLVIALRDSNWLTPERVLISSGILLALEIAVFIFFVAGTHGWIVPLPKPLTTDFVSFYAAGSLADAGTPQDTYNQALHLAAEERATAPGIDYVLFFYPPVFMLICAAFARLPYLAAFVAFEGLTLAPVVLVLKGILREKGWTVLIPVLAFPAVLINIGEGQNAFLTAALFGGATLLIDRKPVLAGLLFGAVCYKPHFGLLIPVALIAGGQWRAVGGAAMSVLALSALSGLALGWDSWGSFLTALTGSHSIYESGQVDFAAFVSTFGALRLIGFSPAVAYAGQIGTALMAAWFVAAAWRLNLSLPTRAATLAAATLVALPLALFYDLMLAAVAMAWVIRAGREGRFLPWEKTLLLVVFLSPLLTRGISNSLHLPVATLACFVLLAVCVARARHELSQRQATTYFGTLALSAS